MILKLLVVLHQMTEMPQKFCGSTLALNALSKTSLQLLSILSISNLTLERSDLRKMSKPVMHCHGSVTLSIIFTFQQLLFSFFCKDALPVTILKNMLLNM